MSAGTPLLSQAYSARRNVDVVVDYDKVFYILLVKTHNFPDGLAGQVHIGLRLYKQDLLAGDSAFADQGLKLDFIDFDTVLFCQQVNSDKAHVMTSVLVFSARVPKTCDYIHM